MAAEEGHFQSAVQEMDKKDEILVPTYFHVKGLTLYGHGEFTYIRIMYEDIHKVFLLHESDLLELFMQALL